MQTLTFTQKLLRQRRFLSFLLPLFAIFVGLGAPQTTLAQSVASDNVTLNVRGTTGTYDTQTSTAGPGVFNGTSFGTFNLANSSDVFNLTGLSFVINDPTNSYDEGDFRYRIYQTGTTAPGFTLISLGTGSYNSSTGQRTFTLSPTVNLLAGLTGGAGTGYSFQVIFRATDNIGGGTLTSAPAKTATFTVTGAPVVPTNINNTLVYINPNSSAATGYTTYNANPSTPNAFQNAPLGSYDVNTGILNLNGGAANLSVSNGDQVGAVRMYYRVFKQGTTTGLPAYQNIALTSGVASTASGTYSNTTAQINLVTQTPTNSGIGDFYVQVYYEADVTPAVGIPRTIRDDNGGNAYTATFTLTGTPILTDTWKGTINNNWFDPGNWDLGFVPTPNTNVIIPDLGSGNLNPVPDIYASTVMPANAVLPASTTAIDNTNSGPAQARNLTVAGSSQAQRTILRLIAGTLQIHGDFTNLFDGFIQRSGSTFELAGGNQTFTGGSNFDKVLISGGGTKTLTGRMNVLTEFRFDNSRGGGVVTTDISRPTVNYIELGDRSSSAPDGAQLIGENEASYIRGFVQTTRANVQANEYLPGTTTPDPRTFGNMGLTLFFKGTNNPGDVYVTRNTAESYTPLAGPSGNQTARYGIRRIFGVRPSSPNTNNGGLIADLTFRYRDAELVNLGPMGTGSIPEPNLALFVSSTGGNTWGNLNKTALDQLNNVLTRNDVTRFATFTLGDLLNPLPVSLIGFTAKRVGTDALVSWETASEQNNKGFEVQVSTDSKEFRTLGFVESKNPNSVVPQSYSFVDVEKNKTGQRYYRLRQLDIDGKATYFGPWALAFDGKAPESVAMTAYPNPFGSADQLHLNLQSALAGTASFTITDMTGRVVRTQKVEMNIGANDVSVDRLSDLKGGLYLVHFVLPTGEVQNLKVMKQ